MTSGLALAGLPSISTRPTSARPLFHEGRLSDRLDERPSSPGSPASRHEAARAGKYSAGTLSEVMAALDGRLRGQLQEQAQHNDAVLRGFKEGSLTLAAANASAAASGWPAPNAASAIGSGYRRAGSGALATSSRPASAGGGTTVHSSSGRPASADLSGGGGAPVASTSGRALGESRWSVNEGGRDTLGWVRSMVRYTEAHPVLHNGTSADDARGDAALDSTGIKKTVLPSLKPARREDVLLLQQWLEGTMKIVNGAAHGSNTADLTAATISGNGAAVVASPLELVDGALHVYDVAWEELRRQVSSECRERGELMAALWEHYGGLVDMRNALVTEQRIADTQAVFGALMEERERLGADVRVLEASIADTDREHQAAEQAAARVTSSLTLKLVSAQRTANDITSKLKVADMTLVNEVDRRLETDQALSNTKELLNRTEHEWLKHRDLNLKLEGEGAVMRDQIADLQKRLDDLSAANELVHQQHAAALKAKAALEMELATLKHEVDTQEILMVGQRQQIKEQDAQLVALRTGARDSTVLFGVVQQQIDQLQQDKEQLTFALDTMTAARNALAASLKETAATLSKTEATLVRAEESLSNTKAALTAEQFRANAAELEAAAQVEQLQTQLRDVARKLLLNSNRSDEQQVELVSMKEFLLSLSRMLTSQGVMHLPEKDDKAWQVLGPMGGIQRVLAAAERHCMILMEKNEALKRENGVLNASLRGEKENLKLLQRDLVVVRSSEGGLIRDKNMLETRLIQSEGLRNMLEGQAIRKEAQILSDGKYIAQLKKDADNLREIVTRSAPYEAKCVAMEPELAELVSRNGILEAANSDSRAALSRMALELDKSKFELQKAVESSTQLIEQVKALSATAMEVENLNRQVKQLQSEVEEVQEAQCDTVDAHDETIRQLELAKFLLRGLDIELLNYGGAQPPSNGGSGAPTNVPTARAALVAHSQANQAQRSVWIGSHTTHTPSLKHQQQQQHKMGAALGSPRAARPKRPLSAKATEEALTEDQAMELTLVKQNARWQKFKISILAWFSGKLRTRLVKETERRRELENELLTMQLFHTKEMRDREEYFSTELMEVMTTPLNLAMTETRRDLENLRGALPAITKDLMQVSLNSSVLTGSLKWWRDKRSSHMDVGCQTGSTVPHEWFSFIQNLPREAPANALSTTALADAIVRIYLRQLDTVQAAIESGLPRNGTSYDAVMAHYNSMKAPGLFSRMFLLDMNSPIARLFRSCKLQLHNTKVSMFGRFVGLTVDGVHWGQDSWLFFLNVLFSLRLLLAGQWKSTIRQWATNIGVEVPLQAVFDVVGNLYNVQTPTDMDGPISKRLATLVLPGHAGPCVDLDALLLLLMTEFHTGQCPRNALLFPRRITDGSLFNIFNVSGYSPQIGAMLAPAAAPKRADEVVARPAPTAAVAKLLARAQAVVQAVQIASRSSSPQPSSPTPGSDPSSSAAAGPSSTAPAAPSSARLSHPGNVAISVSSPRAGTPPAASPPGSPMDGPRVAWPSPSPPRSAHGERRGGSTAHNSVGGTAGGTGGGAVLAREDSELGAWGTESLKAGAGVVLNSSGGRGGGSGSSSPQRLPTPSLVPPGTPASASPNRTMGSRGAH